MASSEPLLSGTIEADEEVDVPSSSLSGNIGESAKVKKKNKRDNRAEEVLVPGTAPRDVEGGIVSFRVHWTWVGVGS